MFAYLDESGNTGPNLFDPNQPWFYYCCVMSRQDIDIVLKNEFAQLVSEVGTSCLHANELGLGRLKPVLSRLQHLIKKNNIRFFLCEVEKTWFVLAKVFDLLFDPVENRAVPRHVYLSRELRHITLFKMEPLFAEGDLHDFWGAMMQKRVDVAAATLRAVLSRVTPRIATLPDERSRELMTQAFKWAMEYPDEITMTIGRKSGILSHLPNVAMFSPALVAIAEQAEYWGSPVSRIRHDRQCQVVGPLKEWHSIMEQHEELKRHSVAGNEFTHGGIHGSQFEMAASEDSCGLQLADVALWLFRQEHAGKHSDPIAQAFMERVRRNAYFYGISRQLSNAIRMKTLLQTGREIPEERLQGALKLLALSEAKRVEAMRQFDEKERQSEER
jgi:hypothetical protein